MRKIAIYILAAASLCLASCISLEDGFNPVQEGKKLTVMASVADFNSLNVNTKALEEEESRVNELTMLIFDSGNAIVGRPVNLSGGSSVFMIDTQNALIIDGKNQQIPMKNDQAMLDSCSIYMVANCWHKLEGMTINKVSELLAVDIPVEAIDIPANGIPMIGVQSGFDLSKDRPEAASTVADIVMDKLYAKVNVRFQVNADQVINTPLFNLKGWTVSNIPAAVRLGEPAEGAETENATGEVLATTSPSSVLSYGRPTIYHSESVANPDYFQFTFYVPEHKVNPTINVTDTVGVPRSEWQRYKPKFCSNTQKPMFVTVKGAYTDHHGQVRDVTYSLYLGQNNTDNFHINRNQELNNIITIKGLTNSVGGADWNPNTPENNISVDHRVDVADNGFSISMEREALLDSHFEVRPMDVFVSNGGKVVVTVNSTESATDGDDWLRIEKSKESADHIAGVGVRKYFTTDLVINTLATDGRSVTINSGDDSRIWLYFDENTNVYDKTVEGSQMHRDITLTVDYYADANSDVITQTKTFSFRQMNLWRVRNAANTRYYDIEYHEEYLYNYVSNDNYGKTTNGMDWGLDGVQLSHIYDACYLNTSTANIIELILSIFGWNKEAIINNSLKKLNPPPLYDFYLSRDTQQPELKVRDYSGYDFNVEITSYLLANYSNNPDAKLKGICLNEDPKSAIAYCNNKNKRNSEGLVDSLIWYLPASDEIEEIAASAYQEFNGVFQGNMYWSCQPAYIYNHLDVDLYRERFIVGGYVDYGQDIEGDYYIDDVYRARATRSLVQNGEFAGILDSGSDLKGTQGGIVYLDGDKAAELPEDKYVITNNAPYSNHPGNLSRTENRARIRCVRNSGTIAPPATN